MKMAFYQKKKLKMLRNQKEKKDQEIKLKNKIN